MEVSKQSTIGKIKSWFASNLLGVLAILFAVIGTYYSAEARLDTVEAHLEDYKRIQVENRQTAIEEHEAIKAELEAYKTKQDAILDTVTKVNTTLQLLLDNKIKLDK